MSGERCALPLPAEDVGPEFVAGGRVYFMQRDPNAATVVIARVGPDGVVEPLPATQAAGDVYYLEQFTVAPDESRLAWSQAHHIIRQFLLQLGRAIPLYWLHWQLNPEYRAFTKSAGDVDGTSQQSEVMLSDRESQPGPLL